MVQFNLNENKNLYGYPGLAKLATVSFLPHVNNKIFNLKQIRLMFKE